MEEVAERRRTRTQGRGTPVAKRRSRPRQLSYADGALLLFAVFMVASLFMVMDRRAATDLSHLWRCFIRGCCSRERTH